MSPPRGPGQLSRLWRTWKALSLPWRRRRLAGSDLTGTTFWYLRPASTPRSLPLSAWRRIAEPPAGLRNYADLQLAPAWHQWLRYTRAEPPSLDEQRADLRRQVNMRELARLADERWDNKESYLGAPTAKAAAEEEGGAPSSEGQEDPWKKNQRLTDGKTGEEWQPGAWAPGGKK